MSTNLMITNARLSYPHLFQPRAIQAGDDLKYSAALIIPKNDPIAPQLLAAIEAEKAAKWGANAPPSAQPTLYDGDTNPKYNINPNNHGMYVLNTSTGAEQPPHLVDENRQKVIDPGKFYAGCYVNAAVAFFGYDKGVSKGIACALNGVQFSQNGERLDGRPSAEQLFGAPTGSPPAIAPGVGQQYPAGTPAQPAPPPAAAVPPAYGVPPQAAAAAPQQPAAAPVGTVPGAPPSFLS